MAKPGNLFRVVAGSAVLSVLLNVTLFKSGMDAATLSVLGEGLRSSQEGELEIWNVAGWRGGLLLGAYHFFGLGGLQAAWIFLHIAPTFLVLCALGGIWSGVRAWRGDPPGLIRRIERAVFFAIFLAAFVYGGMGWARLSAPAEFFPGTSWLQEIAQNMRGSTVFANPTLRARAALLAPGLRCDPVSEPGRLLREPVLWRDHAAQTKPAAVLLSGRVEEYKPLLDYLLEAPAWELAEVNPEGLVFLPKEKVAGWKTRTAPSDSTTVQEEGRALRLARESVYQLQVGHYGTARQQLEEAKKLAPKSAEVLALSAAFLAERGQWPEAAAEASAALALDPGLIAAWQIRLQCELAMQHPSRAAQTARQLEVRAGADDFSWFLIARAANEGNDPALEIRALEKVLHLSQLRNLPRAGYLIFLGQAYARQGFERQAREAWSEALQSGDLTATQDGQVRELLQRLDVPANVP